MNTDVVNTASAAMTIKQMRKRFSENGFRSEEYSITPLIRFEPAPGGFSVSDGIVVGMVCNGTAKMEVNGREFELRRNNMFLLNEESQIASVKSSKACLGYVITFSRKFLEGIDVDIKDFMGARLIFRVKPCLALSQSDADRLHNVALALSEAVDDSDKIYGDKVIASLFIAFFYTMASVLGRYEMDKPQVRKGLRSEELFKQFVEILGEECEKQRSVEYYASRMNITPKYLSLICKSQADKSALRVIDEAVLRRAKDLLMQPGMTIQQVSERLNFMSQSFFGKYFKQRVGISPSRYKMQKL